MNLPFTVEQFLGVFTAYNNAVWPAQLVLNAAALAAIVLALLRKPQADRTVTAILGVLWLWTGLVYHIGFFAAINPVARIFGGACALQGLLFLWTAVRNRVSYRPAPAWRAALGGIVLLYALLIYPVLGSMSGHRFPAAPSFGAPCPTTIFTFGLLLWAARPPRYLLIIPALWSVIGFSAALKLGIHEDVGLLVAGIIGTLVVLFAPRREGKVR
jgi:hypothetical protein